MTKIVIIGAGIAGHSVAVNLREKNKDCLITLISEEAYLPYDRRKLIDYLKGDIKDSDLFLASEDFYKENNINFLKEKIVVSINTNKKVIHFKDSKETIDYEILVICSGKKIVLPEIPGAHKEGVFNFYSLTDLKKFTQSPITDTICVVGSDQGALDLAKTISVKYKVEVKLISLNDFDVCAVPPEVELIKSQVTEIIGEGFAQAIKLKEGKVIAVTNILFKEKLESNINFLKNTQIEILNNQIIVGQNLETNIKNIFSCGSVASYKDNTDFIKTFDDVVNESKILVDNLINQIKVKADVAAGGE
ncbi:MAG: FAD-dependent oxidoreductase [Candidatus Omnitrophota bacterium]